MAWTDVERRRQCEAYKGISQDLIVGTDQTGRTFWAAVAADSRWRTSKVPLPTHQGVTMARPYRTTSAATKEMGDHVAKHVHRLVSWFAAVDRAQLTGNITAEQRELAAAAHIERRNLYDAIRGDAKEQQEAADLHVDQRAATWLSSWRILKDMNKLSGAAGVAEYRADIAFWGGPDVRRTKEAAQWRRLKMRRRIKALAGAALEDNVDDDTVDIGGADVATGVPTRDTTRRGNVEGVPAAMAAAAIAPTPPTGMSAEDGEWLDGLLTVPSTVVAAEAPVSTAVTSGAGAMVAPMSPATPPPTPPTTPAEQSPAAAPDAVYVRVVDVTDAMDLVDMHDDEEMPCTPPAVRFQRTKCRPFVKSRDGH
ncbi:hypothetical protein I4F81_008337 [Pyropia yezoensis]|uniref:Uncharacterized protein n=1 Tax=Pyropia yezoensis TaxID=2788 RepID=A0ACC3C6Q2_PYRYE|nr:hypothetical protein I4F81_008337 [Neopyropia yezoensis]